jgi:hypothetical protein
MIVISDNLKKMRLKMETTMQWILVQLEQASNGKLAYKDLYDNAPSEHRGRLMTAIRGLKFDGKLTNKMVRDADGNLFQQVSLVGV